MKKRVRRRLALAVAVALFILIPQVNGLITDPYDAWTHLFFASHYLHGWFKPIDMRWYLGFPVTRYPPLAHQTLAIVGSLFIRLGWDQVRALTAAYTLLSVAFTGLYPLGVYCYSRVVVSQRAASYAAVVGTLFTGWWTLLFEYGQFPTIMAAVMTLFGGWALSRALRTGGLRETVIATLLTALVPMTHHFTTISFLVAVYLVVVVTHVVGSSDTVGETEWRERLTQTVRRSMPVAIVSVIVATLALLPFLQFLLNGPTQPVIPHGSRQSWFQGAVWRRPQLYLTLVSGTLFLTIIPLAGYVAFRRNETPALVSVAVAVVFGVLSLGFTTPLPRLLYPGLAETLTYFRFGAWGGFLLLPAVGLLVTRAFDGEITLSLQRRRPSRRELAFAFVATLVVSQGVIASQMTALGAESPDRRDAAEEIGEFMSYDEHWKWRYLTLGMAQELGLIGIEAPSAQTVDGNYNAGRVPSNVPVLARSSASQISSAKFSSVNSQMLNYYLDNNHDYGIKFVFSADTYYEPTLRDHGFQLLYRWEWLDVRVWYDPDTPIAVNERRSPAQEGQWGMSAWGTFPVITLLMCVLSCAISKW